MSSQERHEALCEEKVTAACWCSENNRTIKVWLIWSTYQYQSLVVAVTHEAVKVPGYHDMHQKSHSQNHNSVYISRFGVTYIYLYHNSPLSITNKHQQIGLNCKEKLLMAYSHVLMVPVCKNVKKNEDKKKCPQCN